MCVRACVRVCVHACVRVYVYCCAADVLRKYYYPDAFLIQATTECSHLYDNLLLTIQPLAELPFKLHVTFEPQQIFIAGERKRLDKQRRQQQDLEEQRRQQPEQPAGDLQADTSVEVSQPVSPVPLTGFVNGGVIGKRGATPLIGKASTASVQNGNIKLLQTWKI